MQEANEELLDLVLRALDGAELTDAVKLLVYAACEGDDALAQALEGDAESLPSQPSLVAVSDRPEPAGAFLTSISVEGFRGIGPRAELDLVPGPGLTVVAGRNGSGKSSFAEGAEIALTGHNSRWAELRGDWRRGWRNLHHGGDCSIEVALLIEGDDEPRAVVRRAWEPTSDDVDEADVTVQRYGSRRQDYADLGWREPMEDYRPFLSYKELGSLTASPSTMFDKLSVILGLGLITAAVDRLRAGAKERSAPSVQEKEQRGPLQDRLRQSPDERAVRTLELIKKRTPDLDAITTLVAVPDDPDDVERAALRELAALPDIDHAAMGAVIAELRAVASEPLDAEAERDLDVADLLQQALVVHADHGPGACPVCGVGALDDEWADRSSRTVTELRSRAARSSETRRRRSAAVAAGRGVLPTIGLSGSSPVVDPDLLDRLRRCSDDLPEHPAELADRLEGQLDELGSALQQLRSAAVKELTRREDAWRPIAEAVLEWTGLARRARAALPTVEQLKTGEKWLKDTEGQLRNERLAPLAAEAAQIWSELRQESNVELGSLELVGTSTRRRLKIDVSVDGASAPDAVSVMSQGELNALALSIFLPRATLAASPFRFLIIDDPVQAMDPAKVDGLARALARVASNRQVIVFTHDERLPEAVRRLSLPAEIVTVRRRTNSVVDVTVTAAPARRHLSDARALLRDQHVAPHVAAALVPGILRQSVEAACHARIRKLRLAAGDRYADLEIRLTEIQRLTSMLAFACFGDPDRAGDVARHLRQQSQRRKSGDMSLTASSLNKGAHGDLRYEQLEGLLGGTKELVDFLEDVW